MRKYVINKELFYRFEPNFDKEGVLILYFKNKNKMFELSKPFYIYLDSLDKELTTEAILERFQNEYAHLTLEEINNYITKMIDALLNLEAII